MDKGFFEQVYDIVAEIPAGKVMSYGQIAELLGHPRGARTVGWAMRSCPDELNLPWHRVVKKDGSLAPYMTLGVNFGDDIRRHLLEEDGVEFLPDGRVDMEQHQL